MATGILTSVLAISLALPGCYDNVAVPFGVSDEQNDNLVQRARLMMGNGAVLRLPGIRKSCQETHPEALHKKTAAPESGMEMRWTGTISGSYPTEA